MTLTGTRFGDLEVAEQDTIAFPDGLIGFPTAKRFVIICPKAESPFRWLQSLDEPALAFLVTDPANYVPDYAPEISLGAARRLALNEETPRLLLTTVNIPRGKPEAMTLNLAGPIVVNAETRTASQIVLEDGAYTIKHRVFPEADRVSGTAAA